MDKSLEPLFTPMKIGNLEIRNRFVMCAMEQTCAINWMMKKGYNKNVHDLLVERAKDGVGLIIPGTITLQSVVGSKWLYQNSKAFEGTEQLTGDVHAQGAKIFFQLTAGWGRSFLMMPAMTKHPNLIKPLVDLDKLNVSADAGLPNVWMPEQKTRQLTDQDIRDFIHAYAETALLCKQHGADGIEVHAVHEGYLLDQFTTKFTNHRTDQWGGSLENRYRFACEVVKAIKERCGQDYPVILRYSVTSKIQGFNHGILPGEDNSTEIGRDMAESEEAIALLTRAGYDGFDCDNGTYDSWYWAHPPVYMPLNCNLADAEHIKSFTSAPIGCAGRMQLADAAEAVAQGKLDWVGIARQFLTDERFLTKVREGRLDEIRPCISCHSACLPAGQYKGSGASVDLKDLKSSGMCALNPYTGNEKKYALKPAAHPKHIAVIGGGVAGMEFAIQAVRRGHTVDLYEKSDRLGGVFNAAAVFTFKEKDRDYLSWMIRQIMASGAAIHMQAAVTDLKSIQADEYVIATGALETRTLRIPGGERCVPAAEWLLGDRSGDHVGIIGGGLTGCEIAYELAKAGRHPFIVEMQDDIMKVKGISMANSSFLRDALSYYNVPVYVGARTTAVTGRGVQIESGLRIRTEIPADTVLVSIGYKAGTSLGAKSDRKVHVLGDADHVANLKSAVWAADELVLQLSEK